MSEGVLPATFKEVQLCPILKMLLLDSTILDNSSSLFLGKVVEKVALQLQRSLEDIDYLDPFLSAFRSRYGTEIALVMPMDDLWQEQDGGSASIFGLLDLSACFNTINHGILLGGLKE